MSRLLRGTALLLFLFLISAALPTLAQVSQSDSAASQPPAGNLVMQPAGPLHHGVPWRDPNTNAAIVGFAAPQART